jgi:hypothetical protein
MNTWERVSAVRNLTNATTAPEAFGGLPGERAAKVINNTQVVISDANVSRLSPGGLTPLIRN